MDQSPASPTKSFNSTDFFDYSKSNPHMRHMSSTNVVSDNTTDMEKTTGNYMRMRSCSNANVTQKLLKSPKKRNKKVKFRGKLIDLVYVDSFKEYNIDISSEKGRSVNCECSIY